MRGMENELRCLKCFITPNQAEPPPVSPLRGCGCEKRQLMLCYSGGGVVDPAVWLLNCNGFFSGPIVLKQNKATSNYMLYDSIYMKYCKPMET